MINGLARSLSLAHSSTWLNRGTKSAPWSNSFDSSTYVFGIGGWFRICIAGSEIRPVRPCRSRIIAVDHQSRGINRYLGRYTNIRTTRVSLTLAVDDDARRRTRDAARQSVRPSFSSSRSSQYTCIRIEGTGPVPSSDSRTNRRASERARGRPRPSIDLPGSEAFTPLQRERRPSFPLAFPLMFQ